MRNDNEKPDVIQEASKNLDVSLENIFDKIEQYNNGIHEAYKDHCHPLSRDAWYNFLLGQNIIRFLLRDLEEIEIYRRKFTKVRPEEIEMSKIKKCHIGKCKCGQLLIESKDRCCPRCNQFIDWPPS